MVECTTMPHIPLDDPRALALDGDRVRYQVLFRLDFPAVPPAAAGTRRLTTWPVDQTIGGETWTAGEIVAFGPILQPSDSIIRQPRFELDFPAAWRARFGGRIGVRLRTWLRLHAADGSGWLDDLYGLHDLESTGGIAEDSPGIVRVTFASPFAGADPRSQVLLTDRDQRRRSVTDTSMSQVAAVSQRKWGGRG